MKEISLRFIIENSEFCQFSFQLLYNLVGKITTATENASSNTSNSSIKQIENINNFSKKLKPM